MTRIVTTHYRYKPPPRKKQAVPLAFPPVVTSKRKRELPPTAVAKLEPASAIVRKTKPCNDNRPDPAPALLPSGGKKSAIVTARTPGKRYADVPDMTSEEHRRRGDAADALWRELVRRATSKRGDTGE